MYKYFVLLCFVSFCFVKKQGAQNLVPNPSFEQHIDCVTPVLRNAVDWCSVGDNCSYFHPCESNPLFRTPFQYNDPCFQSYQVPRTGQAYAGAYGYLSNSSNPLNRFAFVKLVDTLLINKVYCVTFYLSLVNYCKYSMDKLGTALTSTPFPCLPPATAPNYTVTGVTPQIVSPAGIQLADTLNWMEISGTLVSNGTEAYLTIGDFFLQTQHSIVMSYPTNCNGVAEYYLDDVSVEEVQIAKTKNDTTIMYGDSTVIGNNLSDATLYSWQPTAGLSCSNCPNPKASPSVTTTYTLTKTQCKAITTDQITLTVDHVGLNEFTLSNSIIIQPNPTNGLISINSRYEMQKVEVSNITGQLIISEPTIEKAHQLQLQNFADGIYFIKVIYLNGMSVTKKIIKN